MEEMSNSSRARFLDLLRSLPHPGRVILDCVGNGLSGFSLRPKTIPPKITGTISDLPSRIELQLVKDGKVFSEIRNVYLKIHSDAFQQWIKQKPAFVIRTEDAGKGIDVVEGRQKNFNENLLCEFLEQFSPIVSITRKYQEKILDADGYPLYFRDRAIYVSGIGFSTDMRSIQVIIGGVQSQAIEVEEDARLKYWDFLPKEKMPFMNILLKWHRTLIALHHVMKDNNIDIPIDFKELEKNCRDEISATSNL